MAIAEEAIVSLRTICLIEDDAAMRALLADRVFKTDSVVEFSALKPALRFLRDYSVDQIILDLNLPDSRGAATYHTLSEALPHQDIIIITGWTGAEIEALAEEVPVYKKGSNNWVRLLLELKGRTEALACAMGVAS